MHRTSHAPGRAHAACAHILCNCIWSRYGKPTMTTDGRNIKVKVVKNPLAAQRCWILPSATNLCSRVRRVVGVCLLRCNQNAFNLFRIVIFPRIVHLNISILILRVPHKRERICWPSGPVSRCDRIVRSLYSVFALRVRLYIVSSISGTHKNNHKTRVPFDMRAWRLGRTKAHHIRTTTGTKHEKK